MASDLQYRELAAFAQFASDLDAATRKQLDRGARVTELLKQPQYTPVPLEKQVMILYAVTNGFLDDAAIDKVQPFEAAFHRFMDSSHPEIGQSVASEKRITDENIKALRSAIEEFKRTTSF